MPHKNDPHRGRAAGAEDQTGRVHPQDTSPAGFDLESLPTSAERSEAALLGAMLVSSDALAGACRMLPAGGHLFVRPAHRTLFELLERMHLDGLPVDVVTVTDQLGLAGTLDEVGGPIAVVDLTALETCPVPASWPTYATVVIREARRRRGIRLLTDALARLKRGEDPGVVADELAVSV